MLPVLDREAFARKLGEVFAADRESLRKMGEVSKGENARFWETKGAIGRFVEGVIGE